MPRKAANLYSTVRGRVRASMNKYNVFNLYKKPQVRYQGKSLFQQKWAAKQETRAYHGEHLTEGRWKTLFDPNLESVAQLDASLKGVDVDPTPMSLQTYATLEKRLEFALFRAMFASSIRQAREFIKTGHVKVNGVVIKQGSYPLKTGDVFSVNPEKVMLAMGRVKPSVAQAVLVDNRQIAVWNKYVAASKQNPKDMWDLKRAKPESLNPFDRSHSRDHADAVRNFNDSINKTMLAEQKATTRDRVLSRIMAAGAGKPAEEVLALTFAGVVLTKNDLAKCLDAYTLLQKSEHELVAAHTPAQCAEYISTQSTAFASPEAAKTAANVKKILSELVLEQLEALRVRAEKLRLPDDAKTIPFSTAFSKAASYHAKLDKDAVVEDESKAKVNLPWQKGLFGRKDASKPYFTPWTPRPFIGVFAILPHHIEVSFETCHAIYLHDPVARPGHSEVISPLPDHVHERAYMYYVRKGL